MEAISTNDMKYMRGMALRLSRLDIDDLMQEGCVILCQQTGTAQQNRKLIAAAMFRWVRKFRSSRMVEIFDVATAPECRLSDYTTSRTDRRILEMRYIGDKTFAEIADASGLSYSAVYRRHNEILEQIRGVLAA